MRRAALGLVLLTGACAAASTPSRDELARALGGREPVEPTYLTHIACLRTDAERSAVACRWRQRDYGRWHGWQSHLALSSDGWRLLDAPTRRP